MNRSEFSTRLLERTRPAGLSLPDSALERLDAYFQLLRAWSRRMNLTGFDLEDLNQDALDRLFLEPALPAKFLSDAGERPVRMIDLGSGGGSPGIPVAILLGVPAPVLVEVKSKKCVFLKEAARVSGLDPSGVLNRRFEGLEDEPAYRENFDVVTVRAVRMGETEIALAGHLLRPGGTLVHFGADAAETGQNYQGFAAVAALRLEGFTVGPVSILRKNG